MAALGVVPDDAPDFTQWMKKTICQPTGSALGINVRSAGGNETGGGQAGVRLTVAYFCPAKSAEVEKILEYFKQ